MAEKKPKPIKRREQFFGQQVIRLMTKTALANELGASAFTLLAVVSAQQDAAGGRAVTFYTNQLMPLIGIHKWDTLDGVRKRCVEAGWLEYRSPEKGERKPGLYKVVIPSRFAYLSDSRCDEGSDQYPIDGDRNGDSEYPVNGERSGDRTGDRTGDRHGERSGDRTGDRHGEPPSSTSTSTSTSNKNPRPPSLQTETFSSAWEAWRRHRAEIKKPLKPTMEQEQLAMLEGLGEARAVAMIRHTIAMGWQGLREPEQKQQPQSRPILSRSIADDLDRI